MHVLKLVRVLKPEPKLNQPSSEYPRMLLIDSCFAYMEFLIMINYRQLM